MLIYYPIEPFIRASAQSISYIYYNNGIVYFGKQPCVICELYITSQIVSFDLILI